MQPSPSRIDFNELINTCWSLITIDLALTYIRNLVSIGPDNAPSSIDRVLWIFSILRNLIVQWNIIVQGRALIFCTACPETSVQRTKVIIYLKIFSQCILASTGRKISEPTLMLSLDFVDSPRNAILVVLVFVIISIPFTLFVTGEGLDQLSKWAYVYNKIKICIEHEQSDVQTFPCELKLETHSRLNNLMWP